MGIYDAAAARGYRGATVPKPAAPGGNPAGAAGDGTVRQGAGYDSFVAQSRTPYDTEVTGPDGQKHTVQAGGDLGAAPQWNQNTGPYGAYLNRLNMGAATPGAAGQAAADAATANIAASADPRTNPAAASAAADAAQARAMQMGAAQNLGMAGQDFRNAQGALLGAGAGAAMMDSATQARMAAGAPGADAGSVGYQQNALGMFQDAAMGRGPSAAQAQLRSGIAQNIAAQRAMAAATRGGGAAAAMRQGSQVGTQLALQGQAQAAMLRAQEQQAGMAGLANASAAARAGDVQRYALGADIMGQKRQGDTQFLGTAGQVAGQGRGQDIAQAQGQADYLSGLRGQDIQAGGTFGGLAATQMQLDDARRNAAIQQGLAAEAQRQAGINATNDTMLGAGGLMSNTYLQGRQMSLQNARAKDAQFANTLGAITGGAGALAQAGMPYLAPAGAATQSFPTANSADYLARQRAYGG